MVYESDQYLELPMISSDTFRLSKPVVFASLSPSCRFRQSRSQAGACGLSHGAGCPRGLAAWGPLGQMAGRLLKLGSGTSRKMI
jgi:hypothetical protein